MSVKKLQWSTGGVSLLRSVSPTDFKGFLLWKADVSLGWLSFHYCQSFGFYFSKSLFHGTTSTAFILQCLRARGRFSSLLPLAVRGWPTTRVFFVCLFSFYFGCKPCVISSPDFICGVPQGATLSPPPFSPWELLFPTITVSTSIYPTFLSYWITHAVKHYFNYCYIVPYWGSLCPLQSPMNDLFCIKAVKGGTLSTGVI